MGSLLLVQQTLTQTVHQPHQVVLGHLLHTQRAFTVEQDSSTLLE